MSGIFYRLNLFYFFLVLVLISSTFFYILLKDPAKLQYLYFIIYTKIYETHLYIYNFLYIFV